MGSNRPIGSGHNTWVIIQMTPCTAIDFDLFHIETPSISALNTTVYIMFTFVEDGKCKL